ncbi:hypothetical protein [Culicoidibacter larvae]|uniref:Uncharacterized protein n=1 Tax=Culicoidibacter larvae TaxID=2579976 RepID=A0A5R8Q6X9_9FIRM|nr:hypothetical protein [Culicoidibacter larvae]TLG71169.1 hypothetical protein FEZ08_11485 [Culicoidibacter larvae]
MKKIRNHIFTPRFEQLVGTRHTSESLASITAQPGDQFEITYESKAVIRLRLVSVRKKGVKILKENSEIVVPPEQFLHAFSQVGVI